MAPKSSPARSRSPAKAAVKAGGGSPAAKLEVQTVEVKTWPVLPYYIVSAICFFMGCLHELATSVVMGSLDKGKAHFPQFDNFGDATWKPGEVAFVLAVQFQVGGYMVFVLSWMFFMAARSPAHTMLAYVGIALSSTTALGALQIAFLYDDPHLWSTPMLPVWILVTGIGVVGALVDGRSSAATKTE